MAEGLNITDTSFNGTAATYMIQRAVIGLDSVEEGCLMIQDGIKYKHIIPRMTVSLPFQPRQADPVSFGTITVDGNVLIPQNYMCFTTFNPRDLETYWQSYLLPETLITAVLPQTFEGYLIDTYIKQVNQGNEYMIWRGHTSYNPANGGVNPTSIGGVAGDAAYYYYNGLESTLVNASGTILIAGAVALTSANIISTMNTVYSAIPVAVLRKKNLRFHMSINTWRLYAIALTSNTFKDNQTTEGTIEAFKGYEIVVLGGMSDNEIVACVSTATTESNLWLGLNSTEDSQSVKIAETLPFSELWGLKILMKAGVNYGFAEEVVMYTLITA